MMQESWMKTRPRGVLQCSLRNVDSILLLGEPLICALGKSKRLQTGEGLGEPHWEQGDQLGSIRCVQSSPPQVSSLLRRLRTEMQT